jgi:hypothetical protein
MYKKYTFANLTKHLNNTTLWILKVIHELLTYEEAKEKFMNIIEVTISSTKRMPITFPTLKFARQYFPRSILERIFL